MRWGPVRRHDLNGRAGIPVIVIREDVAAQGLGVRCVDMNDLVCGASRCDTEREGVVMFTVSRSLEGELGKRVEGVLGRGK